MAAIILSVMLAFCHLAFAQGSPNVTLLKHLDEYHSAGYNDCWGYTAPDGREYALLGVQTGTSIIDITDAPAVTEVAFIPSSNSLWKDIKTYQHYAYVVTEASGGMQIIDLSNLPNSAALAGTYTGFQTSHNIYVNVPTAVLYAEGSFSEPVRVISLANPLNPVQVGSFGIECHDVYTQNGIAYVSEGYSGSYGIYDVSNPGSPSLLRRITVPSAGYAHNAWASEDGNYLMTTEETTGKTVKMWDIQDLSNITLKSEYLGPNGMAHNTHIKGDYAYISHYGAGLRIVDISNPESISEAGYYDTESAWGAWPFFDSGKVLISDMVNGLYVVYFEGAVVNPTGIEETPEVPQHFYVSRNYPNPFNPSTTIDYRLSKAGPVRLTIYNSLGQKVRTLVNDYLQPGSYQAVWNGRDDAGSPLGSGAYLYRFEAENFSNTQKMILMK